MTGTVVAGSVVGGTVVCGSVVSGTVVSGREGSGSDVPVTESDAAAVVVPSAVPVPPDVCPSRAVFQVMHPESMSMARSTVSVRLVFFILVIRNLGNSDREGSAAGTKRSIIQSLYHYTTYCPDK